MARPAPDAAGPGQGIPRSTLFVGGILLALMGGGVALVGIRRRSGGGGKDVAPTPFLDDEEDEPSSSTSASAASRSGDATTTAPWPARSAGAPASDDLETTAAMPVPDDLEITAPTPIPDTPGSPSEEEPAGSEGVPVPDPVAGAQTSIFDSSSPEAEASQPIDPEEIAVNEIPPTEGAKPDLAATMVSPSAPPPAPAPSSGGDSSRLEELERRMALLETRLEEVVDAKERLERQVVAQTEELRVQRAAIARTQRVLRGMARPEDEATEPAPKS